MTSTRVQVAIVSGIVALGGLVMLAQAPREQREGPPTAAQLKDAVSRLRGNRIATPNDYDKLTPEQKKYVESILSGPRSDISGPLGVMMVSPALGDLSGLPPAAGGASGTRRKVAGQPAPVLQNRSLALLNVPVLLRRPVGRIDDRVGDRVNLRRHARLLRHVQHAH